MSVSYTPLSQDQGGDLDKLEILNSSRNNSTNNTATLRNSLITDDSNSTAPIAKFETDEDMDERQIVSSAHAGIDGFETLPSIEVTKSTTPDPLDSIPILSSRAGTEEGEKQPDELDVPAKPNENRPFSPTRSNTNFPGFGFDIEAGTVIGDGISIPDVNIYQHKKTLAQGMMDLALFSANANQLRYVLESYERHPYYYASVIFISISILIQVAIGVGLIWNATYNVKDEKEICIANKINNFTVIGIFLVTVVNVFISAFGVATPT